MAMSADFVVEPRGRPLPLQRIAAGCHSASGVAVGEERADATPLLRLPRSSSLSAGAAPPALLADADLEDGRGDAPERAEGAEDGQRPASAWVNEHQALWRAMQRPGVAVLVAVLLGCVAVCVGCWALNLVGWVVVISSLSCGRQAELRDWLLAYLVGVLVEVGLLSLARACHTKLVQDLDWHAGPGFVRACNVCFTLFSSALKVFWCVHAQVLVAAAKGDTGCGAALPHFISVFSVVVLLRLLAVDTFLSLLAGLVLRFMEANSPGDGMPDHDQAGGPAKPGTLEAMEQVKFRPALFDGTDLARECCFCLEDYDESQAIVITHCRHTMHNECLEKWLRKSHFCPMCRGDLEVTPPTDTTALICAPQ